MREQSRALERMIAQKRRERRLLRAEAKRDANAQRALLETEDQLKNERLAIVEVEKKLKTELAWDAQASSLRAARRADKARRLARATSDEVERNPSPIAKLVGPW